MSLIRWGFETTSGVASRNYIKKLEKMIELTERYCVIYQTLAKPPKLESEFEVLQ